MKTQRVVVGVLAALFLIGGFSIYLGGADENQITAGILVRVGMLLLGISIAWQEIMGLQSRMSAVLAGIAIVLLFVLATRPRIFPFAAALLVGGFILNGIMRRFSLTKKP